MSTFFYFSYPIVYRYTSCTASIQEVFWMNGWRERNECLQHYAQVIYLCNALICFIPDHSHWVTISELYQSLDGMVVTEKWLVSQPNPDSLFPKLPLRTATTNKMSCNHGEGSAWGKCFPTMCLICFQIQSPQAPFFSNAICALRLNKAVLKGHHSVLKILVLISSHQWN